IIGQNLKFDHQWLKYFLGTNLKTIFDTYIASILLDFEDKHDLATILNRYLNVSISKEEQKSDWSGVLTTSQLEYAARDINHLFPLRDKLIDGLKESKQLKAMQLEMQVLPIIADMEIAGVPVNKERFYTLIDHLEQEKVVKGKKLQEWFLTNG